MKIIAEQYLIRAGEFPQSEQWGVLRDHILQAIQAVEWPEGSGACTLYPQSGKKRDEGNGVVPLKRGFVGKLDQLGWDLETELDIATAKKPGPIDATYRLEDKFFAVEWETGNISSSHRAMNKMALGLLQGSLIGGALVLPVAEMAQYLTDRIGNYPELEPYFPLWQSLAVDEGLLMVFAIQHDAVSLDVPRVPKGTDGRARG